MISVFLSFFHYIYFLIIIIFLLYIFFDKRIYTQNDKMEMRCMDLEKEVRRLKRQYVKDIHVIGRLNTIYKKVFFGRSISYDDVRFINSLKK